MSDPISDTPRVDPDLQSPDATTDPDAATTRDAEESNTTGSAAGDVEADTASGGAPER